MTARNSNQRDAAFTLAELLISVGVFGVFAAALLITWSSVGYSALNTVNYARRQNDQTRVLDYLKRDIRRASKVELYNGAVLVTGINIPATQLKLTIADYYADSREDDDSLGGLNAANTPSLSGSVVSYGGALTVHYFAFDGAGIRQEQGVSRKVSESAGAFAFTFSRTTSGAIRCRIAFDQSMRGGNATRVLHRQAETLCLSRAELQQ